MALIHFTSLETCKIILETRRLRLTRCDHVSNRATETMALYSAANYCIDSLDPNELAIFLNKYNSPTKVKLLETMISERESSYMTCFTRVDKPDDVLLDHKYSLFWKFYADDSNGVAIEFDQSHFPSKQGVSGFGGVRSDTLNLFDMNYGKDDLKEWIDLNSSKSNTIVNSLHFDRYKPSCCENEKETRLLVYLSPERNNNLSYTMVDNMNDVRGLHKSKGITNGKPEYLDYDIAPQDDLKKIIDLIDPTYLPSFAITKIYCKSKETEKNLNSWYKTRTKPDIQCIS